MRVHLIAIPITLVSLACGTRVMGSDLLDDDAEGVLHDASTGASTDTADIATDTTGSADTTTGEATTTGGLDCSVAADEIVPALDVMVAAAVAHFEAEHPPPEGTDYPLHHCPYQASKFEEYNATTTPNFGLSCSDGPEGRCVPAIGGGAGAGYYDLGTWIHNRVWAGLGFVVPVPHVGHYDFEYSNALSGYGECRFTAEAFADLDEDLVFSTFTRAGVLSERGSVIYDLEISMPCE